MAVTIRMIAEKAGVSRGTVDRALNNRPGVNAEVAAHVRRIAKELNYEPNAVAKALAISKRKLRVDILLNSGQNPFFEKVRRGIQNGMREIRSYGITVETFELTGFSVEEQLQKIDELMQNPPNALVITPINDHRIIDRLNQIAAEDIAVVTLNMDVTGLAKLCFIGCDYVRSGQTAAELLGQITAGEISVGILTGSAHILGHQQRVDGFSQVCEQDYPRIHVRAVAETEDDNEIGYRVTKEMLKNHSLDALYFCAGGIDGGIRAVKECGLEKKLKIITVDDTDNIKAYIESGIVNATVCQQPMKQGHDAVTITTDWLLHEKRPSRKHLYTQNEVKLRYNLD